MIEWEFTASGSKSKCGRFGVWFQHITGNHTQGTFCLTDKEPGGTGLLSQSGFESARSAQLVAEERVRCERRMADKFTAAEQVKVRWRDFNLDLPSCTVAYSECRRFTIYLNLTLSVDTDGRGYTLSDKYTLRDSMRPEYARTFPFLCDAFEEAEAHARKYPK